MTDRGSAVCLPHPPDDALDIATATRTRLEVLLAETVELLLHTATALHTSPDEGTERPLVDLSRAAADAARLTAAVAQLVRAHHLYAGPASADASDATALAAMLAEMDAELAEGKETTRP